jgi:hypothetical protein
VKTPQASKDDELDVGALRELPRPFKGLYEFPTDPAEQLQRRSALSSTRGWRSAPSVPADQPHPLTSGARGQVQQMVFGNKGDTAAAAASRFSR